MAHHRRRHQRFKLKSLYVWHRYVGLAAALFVILLAISGIALNHTEGFKLDSRYVQHGWLLDWYGIEAPQTAQHYRAGTHSIALLDTQLFIDTQQIAGEHSSLSGSLTWNDMLVVALQDGLLLLTPNGELIERLAGNEGVPLGIQRLGTSKDGDLILASRDELYSADQNLLRWNHWPGSKEQVNWSEPSALDIDQLRELQARFRQQILPWERVLLDLHSGRIFGNWGPWLMDAAAGLMLFLAVSGTFIWWKRQR